MSTSWAKMIAPQSCFRTSAGLHLHSALAGLGLGMAVRKKKKGIKTSQILAGGKRNNSERLSEHPWGFYSRHWLYPCTVQGLQATAVRQSELEARWGLIPSGWWVKSSCPILSISGCCFRDKKGSLLLCTALRMEEGTGWCSQGFLSVCNACFQELVWFLFPVSV